jgi:predicted MFS family arabinose efflux permease
MVLPFLVLYLTRSLGLTPSRAALALAVYGIGAVITAPLAGRLADRSGPRRIVIGSLFVSAILLLFMPLARTLPSVLVMTLAWSVAGEALRPASLAWLTDLVPPDRRRAGFALNRLAVNLGMSLGPAIAGFVAQVSFTAIFVLDALTSLLAGALLLLATRPGPHDARPAGDAAAAGAPDRRRAWSDPTFLYFLAAILPVQIVFFQHEAAMPLFLVRDLGLARGGWSASATVVVWTFGEMILLPCTAAFVAEAAPPGRRGEYLGLYSMSFSSAFAVAPWIGARIMESWGSRVVWACSFAAGLLSVAMVLRLRAVAVGPAGAGSGPRHAPDGV